MNENFRNVLRTRAYGKRIGDIVEYRGTMAVVVRRCADNNRIYVQRFGEDKPDGWVAEWCTITKKIVDIEDAFGEATNKCYIYNTTTKEISDSLNGGLLIGIPSSGQLNQIKSEGNYLMIFKWIRLDWEWHLELKKTM